jgi:hypothetical protein
MLDDFTIYSDAQAITATAASTKPVLFMPFTGRGEPVKLRVTVLEDFNNLTSLNIKVQETNEEDTDFSAATDANNGVTVPLADLKKGAKIALRFLPKIKKERTRLLYTVVGSAPTTGKVFAAVVEGEDLPIEDGLYFRPRNPSGAIETA